MTFRQNVRSDFGTGGTGLVPDGASVAAPQPLGSAAPSFGTPAIPQNPDLTTILWAMLARSAPAMATYAALAAFGAGPAPSNTLDRSDGMLALVAQDGRLWRWTASSLLPAGADVFLAGDAPATGRWIAIGSPATPTTPTPVIPVDLKGAILAAGTPLPAFSSPAVGFVVTGSKSLGIRWHAGTLTTVWVAVDIPPDMDRDYPVTMSLLVSKTGATATDVVSFTVAAYAQAASFPAAVLEDASPNLGGVTPALTSAQAALAAGTITKLQLGHALLPPPGVPTRVSMSITPSGTLATDDVIVEGVWMEYVRQPAPGRAVVDVRAALLAAGTPMAAWASTSGASSSPGVTLSNSKAVAIKWNNNATQTAVFTSIDLPYDLDVTKPVLVRGLVSKTGATSGDAVTLDVAIFQQIAGALEDATSGTLGLGGTSSAIVGTLTAKTVSQVAYVIPANTLTAAPNHLTISVKPTNGTLGTDNGLLDGFGIEYQRKPNALALMSFDMKDALLAAGTPMAAWASTSGASSSPGATVSNSKAVGVKWNNNATQTAVYSDAVLPFDFDVSQPCTMVFQVSKTGATAADASTMTVSVWEQVPGSTDIGGPTFAGVSSAIAAPTAVAKTISRLTVAIPGGTFTTAPGRLTASVKPTNGTLGTDNLLCCGCWIEYTPKAF